LSELAIGTFADLWLYSGGDSREKLPGRDYGARIVANHGCATCGAKAGELCTRLTDAGLVQRRLPHAGRGGPSLRAHNATYRGPGNQRGAG